MRPMKSKKQQDGIPYRFLQRPVISVIIVSVCFAPTHAHTHRRVSDKPFLLYGFLFLFVHHLEDRLLNLTGTRAMVIQGVWLLQQPWLLLVYARAEAGDGISEEQEVHVLAVDDSLIDRKMIERLLTTSACRVTAVDSGQRALEVLETLGSVTMEAIKINLIITDYCMPGMTGYDLLKVVKGTCSLKEIPVVILSSENVPNRVKRCLAEGAEDFLFKPLQPADMKRLRGHVRSCSSNASAKLI